MTRLLQRVREWVCWLDLIGGSHQWDIYWDPFELVCWKCGARRKP